MTYNEFINDIINTRGQWNIPEGEYKERHHIVPKCMGGSNDKENIIWLYAREHFIVHKLLAEENPDNYSLACAYFMMAFPKSCNQNRYELTPEEYESARIFCAIRASLFFKGYKHNDEFKEKISLSNIKKWKTAEYRNKVTVSLKKALNTPEMRHLRSVNSSGINNSMARKVLCVETGQVFNLVKDAVDWLKELTGHAGAVGRSCKLGTATMGYHFKYCDDKNPNYASGRHYNYVRPKEVTEKVSMSLHIYHENKNK